MGDSLEKYPTDWFGMGIIIALVAAFIGYFVLFGEPAAPPSVTESTARIACEKEVRARLKAPSTADFPWEGQTVEHTGTIWVVRGAVDAQNSFGAMLRNRYVCTLEFSDAVRYRAVVTID